ncbi:MAG TPA: hypothetical protein VFH39_01505 [Candidatus Saccharimonadales bacterium]|nr:hypothetical protein [Candidatus Saccharimonadales bacterium]
MTAAQIEAVSQEAPAQREEALWLPSDHNKLFVLRSEGVLPLYAGQLAIPGIERHELADYTRRVDEANADSDSAVYVIDRPYKMRDSLGSPLTWPGVSERSLHWVRVSEEPVINPDVTGGPFATLLKEGSEDAYDEAIPQPKVNYRHRAQLETKFHSLTGVDDAAFTLRRRGVNTLQQRRLMAGDVRPPSETLDASEPLLSEMIAMSIIANGEAGSSRHAHNLTNGVRAILRQLS